MTKLSVFVDDVLWCSVQDVSSLSCGWVTRKASSGVHIFQRLQKVRLITVREHFVSVSTGSKGSTQKGKDRNKLILEVVKCSDYIGDRVKEGYICRIKKPAFSRFFYNLIVETKTTRSYFFCEYEISSYLLSQTRIRQLN